MTQALIPPAAHVRQHGVTLIEMMVAIAVLAILLAIAVPSFQDFRERSAIRGAAEQLVAVLANARFESVKRNTPITLDFQRGSANTAWCIGAITGTAACDCFQKDPSGSGFCTVALYPRLDNGASESGEAQATTALKGVQLTTDPSAAMDSDNFITFDPLTGTLSNVADGGTLTVQSASMNYRLQFTVNGLGRATLCAPAGGRSTIGYQACP